MTADGGSRGDIVPGARSGAGSAPYSERLGAHRPRRSPLLDLLPLLAVVLIVAAVGVGVWQLASSAPSTVASSGGPADPGADDDPAAGAPASATSTGSPTSTGSGTAAPSATATSPATATATDATTAAGPVDRSLPVTVVNATGRSGLAGRAATTLRSAGWTALTANGTERPATTVVYYSASDTAATAQAVAADLAGGDVVTAQPTTTRSTEFGTDRITVVIGADAAD